MRKRPFLTLAALVCLTVMAPAQGGEKSKTDAKDAKGEKPLATYRGHITGVTGLAFRLDGNEIVSVCSRDVRIWDPANGKEVRSLKEAGGQVVAISADGKTLAIAHKEEVTLHDLDSGKKRLSIDPHGDFDPKFPFRPRVAALAFSPDGRYLATAGSVARVGGRHGYPGGVVAIWDTKTGKALHRFDRLSTGASTVSFSGDGKRVAGGTNGAGGELPEPAQVWVWDVEKGTALHSFPTKKEVGPGEYFSAADVVLSPDGKRVAAAVGSGSRGRPAGLLVGDRAAFIQVWDLTTGRAEVALLGHSASIEKLAFRPDGKQLASAGTDRAVRLWNLASGKQVRSFSLDDDRIEALAFSPDGTRLAAGGIRSGEILVWTCPKD